MEQGKKIKVSNFYDLVLFYQIDLRLLILHIAIYKTCIAYVECAAENLRINKHGLL
jgi:hypothetical protein